ncbi:hypothetical protein RQP46_000283 [Phenoliferia psychrophenolica]
MVGVGATWTEAQWLSDIKLAASGGFDGFALNAAEESLIDATAIATAFSAAKSFGTTFKLFISFDMTVFPCIAAGDATVIIALSKLYASHSNQATYKSTGQPIFSTFGGSDCTFGQSATGTWSQAWSVVVLKPLATATGKTPFFIPAMYEVNSATFNTMPELQGVFNWMGDTNLTWDSDKAYISGMSDSQNRDSFVIEAVTWNDYGESTYLSPVLGTDSINSAWCTGLEHSSLLSANFYYSEGWKTGTYPKITTNVIHLQARPHPNAAKASNDSTGAPAGGSTGGNSIGPSWEIDSFFALIFATAASSVTMTSGKTTNTFSVAAGVTHLSSPLEAGSGMSATLSQGGKTVVTLAPSSYTFNANPTTYNFNYYFFSSA